MKSCLNVIIDTSGSMNEMGKIHLQKNLCRTVTQRLLIDPEKYVDVNVRFFHWSQSISEIIIQSEEDVSALNAEGSLNLRVLSEFLSKNIDDDRQRFLILSDGNFPSSDILSFQKKLSSFPDLIIRTVAVGADADLLKLRKVSTNNGVHLSENIASAIDISIFGNDKCPSAPRSTAQILQSKPTDPAEPEEDWDA